VLGCIKYSFGWGGAILADDNGMRIGDSIPPMKSQIFHVKIADFEVERMRAIFTDNRNKLYVQDTDEKIVRDGRKARNLV
jgi:hypothetical protein